MVAPRLRRVSSRKEIANLIDDYVNQGYAILEQNERNTMIRKKDDGSMLVWGLQIHHFCLLRFCSSL